MLVGVPIEGLWKDQRLDETVGVVRIRRILLKIIFMICSQHVGSVSNKPTLRASHSFGR